MTAVAFNHQEHHCFQASDETTNPLRANQTEAVAIFGPDGRTAVRRFTPRECEALQGFPPDYTLVPRGKKPGVFYSDGDRYEALGNSMAVPVMLWVGRRIAAMEALADASAYRREVLR